MSPFEYPPSRAERRHGPRGYSSYARFLPWLRDEHEFRCTYCLSREQWVVRLGGFVIDHFVPAAFDPQAVAEYDNLLYACTACNVAKGIQVVPDPTKVLAAGMASVQEDGRIEGHTRDAQVLIDAIGLNDPEYVRFRRNWIAILRLAQINDPELYGELMRYPDDLPDLSRLRPPEGNTRPEGIGESCFARRERGELAETY